LTIDTFPRRSRPRSPRVAACRTRIDATWPTRWIDIEPQGRPSKWVTLRACRVLRSVAMARRPDPASSWVPPRGRPVGRRRAEADRPLV